MTTTVRIDQEQGRYVFKCGDGFSCRGFDSLFKETKALAERLGQDNLVPADDEFGTLSVLDKHQQLIKAAAARNLGTWFNPDTPKKVREILERARRDGTKLRVFLGDPATGRDWMEENDVIGCIGRSTGILNIPLLIAEGEHAGPGLLDSCIVRIIRVGDKKELYRHPKYHQEPMQIISGGDTRYPVSVQVDGKTHASFTSLDKACHWVAFMAGEVMEPM